VVREIRYLISVICACGAQLLSGDLISVVIENYLKELI